MLNKAIIMGRLTRDPELRRTQNGVAVAAFSLAVEQDDKGPDGTRATDFIDCVAWRNTADYVYKYFTKGRMAVVEGKIQVRSWKDQDGNNRRIPEVVAESVYFADSKRTSSAAAPAPATPVEPYELIGQRIKYAREKAGFTQAELAAKLGIPYQSISQWERDVRKPKIKTICRIAEAMKISPQELLSETEVMPEEEAGELPF